MSVTIFVGLVVCTSSVSLWSINRKRLKGPSLPIIGFKAVFDVQFPTTATTRKGGNCHALQLDAHPTSRKSFWDVLAKFVLHMRTNCYFPASVQTSYIASRFSDPDFLTESNNLATTMFTRCNLDIWRWTFVVHRMSRDQTLYRTWPKSNNPIRIKLLIIYHIFAGVTSRCDLNLFDLERL